MGNFVLFHKHRGTKEKIKASRKDAETQRKREKKGQLLRLNQGNLSL